MPCHRSPHPWRAAQAYFFAGVRKRIGHMSMCNQSATLTLAFSLLAASRCLEEQQTDGARGDPPAGGRESCTSRACCARLGACAPLAPNPPASGLRKLELSWVLDCRAQVQFAVADRSTRAPPLVPMCAGHFLRYQCLLLLPGTGSCGQQRQRRPSEAMQLSCRLCGARVWQHWKAPCARCAAALLLLAARRKCSEPRCA